MRIVDELIETLRTLRDDFDLASVAATHITADGTLLTLTVYRSLITIQDEHGHMHVVEPIA